MKYFCLVLIGLTAGFTVVDLYNGQYVWATVQALCCYLNVLSYKSLARF